MITIPEWRHGWRYYTVWLYTLIGALPDIYDAVAATGWFDHLATAPAPLKWTLRSLAVAGIVIRFVRQARPKALAGQTDATDEAGT